MLNEFREYYEYTNINKDKKPRLIPFHIFNGMKIYKSNNKYTISLKHFSCFSRPLTIIARRHLFHDQNDKHIDVLVELNSKNKSEYIAKAKKELKKWCNDVFPMYIENTIKSKAKKKKDITEDEIKEMVEKMQNNYKTYLNRIEGSVINKLTGTESIKEKDIFTNRSLLRQNEWSYDSIIADALNAGPLQNIKCLVSKDLISNVKTTNNITDELSLRYLKVLTYYYVHSNENKRYLSEPFGFFACWLGWGNRNDQSPLMSTKIKLADKTYPIFEKYNAQLNLAKQTNMIKISDTVYDYIISTQDLLVYKDLDDFNKDKYILIED